MKIAIVGAGKLGLSVAEALVSVNYDVTMIDTDDDILSKVSQRLDLMTYGGNGIELEVLEECGIGKFDFLLACTGSDEKNILVASFAKNLGCKKVIARVRDPEYMKQLEFITHTMNIDHIVNPDLSITVEIYRYLAEKYTLQNGMFTSGKAALIEFKATKFPKIIDKPLSEINEVLPELLVVAISKKGKILIPHGDTIVEEGDWLYTIGEKTEVERINKKIQERGKYTNIQNIMIIGGGKTGYYLAKKLSEFGASVKLIEANRERCKYLSTHLKNVIILHGDGTDQTLLDDENFEEMDAVVTTTGFDEENMLLALMAKQVKIRDVICKVSRKSFQPLVEALGIDMALNPLDITTTNILQYIQGTKRIISSILIQGQAEIMEVIAVSGTVLTQDKLKNLTLPKGAIVAAIHRGAELIIPNGETQIEDGDRVILFCLLSEISELEKLFNKSSIKIFDE